MPQGIRKRGRMSGNNQKIGGKSVVDEALTGLVTKGVLTLLNSVEHKETVQKMLRALPPLALMVMDPVVLQTALAAMPDFGHPEIAHMVKDVLVSSSHSVEDMVHDAKMSGDDRVKAGLTAGLKNFSNQKFGVLGRFVHRLECGELPPARAQGGGKKGEAPKQPRNEFREISLPEAIRQRYFLCQICFGGALDGKMPQTSAPAAQSKIEPLQIIAACKDQTVKDSFVVWMKALSTAEKARVWSALKHLSSEEEFVGMMTIVTTLQPSEHAAFVGQLETMLQADEGKRAETRGFLGSIGGVIQGGGALAMDLLNGIWTAKLHAAKPEPTNGAVQSAIIKPPVTRKRIGIIRALGL